MKYNRTEISGNIGFTSVIDEKFKTASLRVRFLTKLSPDTASANLVGVDTATYSNGNIRTFAEFNEKTTSLYGASVNSFSSKMGDIQIIGIVSSWLLNKYAIDGEDIEGEMLSIVRDCIFNPNADNRKFDGETFSIARKELIDRIDSDINNKRSYAIDKAIEIAFRGEPAQCKSYGTRESAEAVTAESAYTAYINLLKNAVIEIDYVAPEENNAVLEMFRENFSAVERNAEEVSYRNPSPLKAETLTETEEFDVRQCKMVMTFKTDCQDKYSLKMLNMILGETPVSKLFMNVREKMSLCYYCASRIIATKGAMMIDVGVEKKNIEKTKAEILHQLDEIKNGNITDEEMASALLSIDNSLTATGDTPSSYSAWFFDCHCEGKTETPAERFAKYCSLTKEDIIKTAKSFRLDSIYIMYNKEEQTK